MLEDFSGGYYRSRMDVQSYDGGPVIEKGVYDFINRELYSDSEKPIVMRIGLDAGDTFSVGAEAAIPREVLAVPEDLFDEGGVRNVFVLKSGQVDVTGDYYG